MTLDELRTQVAEAGKQEAAKRQVLEMYPCPVCSDLHEWSSDAADCCSSMIDSVYVCGICFAADKHHDDEFDSEKEVIACMSQLDFICLECVLKDCDTESLWCARAWAEKPNKVQRLAMEGRKPQTDRRQYWKDYYRKRIAQTAT